MLNVLGLDVGGANTKAALVSTKNGCVESVKVASEYFPVWKCSEKLGSMLERLGEKLCKSVAIDLVAITITAELSDAYRTKREGLNHILAQVATAFPKVPVLVLDVDGRLRTFEEAQKNALKVAAANWAATGWFVSQLKTDCVVIDVGSTTTSIIPIVNGTVAVVGKTDLEKLVCGELVYTGSLRTNVAAIVDSVPVGGCVSRVSSELFAQSADVHLILGNISEADYTVDSADGKGKGRAACFARLARVVCADIEMLNELELLSMARYVWERQIEQISSGLKQVCGHLGKMPQDVAVVVTGLGRNFLARKAACGAGFAGVVDFGELIGGDVARVSTAFAVALLGASHLEGRFVAWMR